MSKRNPNYTRRPKFQAWQQTKDGMQLRIPASIVGSRRAEDADIDPFVTGGTTQLFPLGTELWWGDRKFRYAKAGVTALATGKLMQSVVPLAGHIDEVASGTAGNYTINFTPNTVTTDNLAANELQDGYIHTNSGTGLGYMFRIMSHPAIVGGVSGVLTLYDDIKVTLASTPKATVIHHPMQSVIIQPAAPTAMCCGVTVCAVTGSDYCWLQTWGPCAVLAVGTLVIKNAVVPGTTAGGVMARIDFQIEPDVGIVIAVNAATEYAAIDLRIS